MFEKEAEEYIERALGAKYLSAVVAKDKLHAYKIGQYDGYIQGAKYGYNKANEWHYMKDGDFPPENVPLNIITFDKDKKRRIWEGEYKGGNGQWWTGYFNHYIDVPYAWKEIVLPELSKESE